MSCRACSHDPDLKKDWGCEEPTHDAVWVDDEDEDEFHTCPIRFIPGNVFGWFREYTYAKDFPGAALPYHRRSARWIEAYETYNAAYGRYLKEMAANRRQGGGSGGPSDDDKERLKRIFKGKRDDGT